MWISNKKSVCSLGIKVTSVHSLFLSPSLLSVLHRHEVDKKSFTHKVPPTFPQISHP